MLLAGSAYVALQASGGNLLAGGSPGEDAEFARDALPIRRRGQSRRRLPRRHQISPPPRRACPTPSSPRPEAAAYAVLAPELPGTTPESIKGVYISKIDKSWASVRFEPEDEGKPFVVFAHKDGDSWKAEKSVRADEPDYAKNDVVPLAGVPEDLDPVPLRGERVRGQSARSRPSRRSTPKACPTSTGPSSRRPNP